MFTAIVLVRNGVKEKDLAAEAESKEVHGTAYREAKELGLNGWDAYNYGQQFLIHGPEAAKVFGKARGDELRKILMDIEERTFDMVLLEKTHKKK